MTEVTYQFKKSIKLEIIVRKPNFNPESSDISRIIIILVLSLYVKLTLDITYLGKFRLNYC